MDGRVRAHPPAMVPIHCSGEGGVAPSLTSCLRPVRESRAEQHPCLLACSLTCFITFLLTEKERGCRDPFKGDQNLKKKTL